MKSDKKGGIKTKIICKYFIQGKCTKGDSCPYLHSKVEKPKDIIQTECPMYNIGFCKNGRNCHFLHIKKDKYVEEKIEDKNKDSNTPMEEEEKNDANVQNKEEEKTDNNISNKEVEINNDKLENKEEKNVKNISKEDETKKADNTEKKEEEIRYPEIPIWYLEHYFDKPIPLIFSELEQKNLPEITELKKKYGFTNIQPNLPIFPGINKKNKMNLNMNTLNLNFNNFNMNFAFNNNNKADMNNKTNNNIIQNSFQVNKINIGQNSSDKKYDKYELKKNSIEFLLNKQENIFYYLIRCKNYREVEKSQASNTISLPLSLYEKYKSIDIQKMTIIIIICEEEFENFSGFAKLKTLLITDKKEEGTSFNIEWLWRTKLSLSKVNHLMNKADNDNFLIEGKNGCEVDRDLGFFCCRYMMKRLSKEEINELTSEKKMFESEKKLLQLQNLNNERYNQINGNSSNNLNKVNNSNKDLNYVHKKYENNEINSYYNNSNKKSDKSNTNSTKYSDHKQDKNKDYLKYKDHKQQKYTGNKRHRNYSRSRSRSNNRRDNSEDYSNDHKNKRAKYQENDKYYKFNHNNRNGNSYYNNSNNKNYLNQRNHNYHKENNLYQKNKYNDNKGDYSNKKYYK